MFGIKTVTHSAVANSVTEICSGFCSGDLVGGEGTVLAIGSTGFNTAARPTDFIGDTVSVIDTTSDVKTVLFSHLDVRQQNLDIHFSVLIS